MEIQRTAAASTYVTFPMLSNTGVPQTGLTVLGHWLAWADTASPAGQSLRPLSGAVVEIDTSAVYTCPLASTELPVASPYVLLRFSTAGVATQYLLVRTATLFANVQAVTAGAITAGSIAADAIGASELAADAVAEIADAVWDEVIYGAHNSDNTAGKVLFRQYHATDYLNAAITSRFASNGTLAAVGAGAIDSSSFAAGAIDAAAIAADAIGASELAADGASEYADAFLGRNLHRGASGGRTVGQALMALRNKVSISAGTLTVTGENDTTTEWTAAIATEAVTAIVTSIDPA
jgi:hypothetical protein